MAGMMAMLDLDAQPLQTRSGGTRMQVAAAHPAAADTDEMQPALAVQDTERRGIAHSTGSFFMRTSQTPLLGSAALRLVLVLVIGYLKTEMDNTRGGIADRGLMGAAAHLVQAFRPGAQPLQHLGEIFAKMFIIGNNHSAAYAS